MIEGNGYDKSIILIGMPGAGKSTVGPCLASKLGLPFADTDELVKKSDGRSLKEIVAADGFQAFLDLQQKVIFKAKLNRCIIATGGGVVKSDQLMQYFKSIGTIIYLKQEFEVLEKRLAPGRKLARADGQTFRQLFEERQPLYLEYADRWIDCADKAPEEIVGEIILLL